MNTSAKPTPVIQPLTGKMDLRNQIKRFAEPILEIENGYRRLSGQDAESLLESLLREVHETVLPRKIKVTADSGNSRYLNVSGRRLISISLSENEDFPIARTATEMVDQLGSLFAYESKAFIQVEHAAPGQIHPDSGCSALDLAVSLSVQLVKPTYVDPVPEFFNSINTRMAAWIALDPAGNPFRNGGDATWIQRLADLSKNGLAEIDTQLMQSLASPDHPGCAMLSLGNESSMMLVYARSNSSGFAAVLPAKSLSAVQTAWKTSLG